MNSFMLSRKKKTSKMFYASVIISLVFGLALIVLGIVGYLRNKDFINFIFLGLGSILTIISACLFISYLLTLRSYKVVARKNREFMLKSSPIRVKCFGIRDRENRKFGHDWQIIAMYEYSYYYSDFIFGESMDDEEIREYSIDLYLADDKYYLDLDSLRIDKSYK